MTSMLHNVGWLVTGEDGRLALTDKPHENALTSPHQLGEGRYEIHWMADNNQALGFCIGLAVGGRNAVTGTVGQGRVAQAVLVHKADEQPSAANSLSEAVPFIEHASATKRRAVVKWEKHVDNLLSVASQRHASAMPVYIQEETEDHLKLKVAFRFWYHRPHLQNGMDYHVQVMMEAGSPVLVFSDHRYLISDALVGEFRERYVEKLKTINGWLEGNNVKVRVGETLLQTFEDIEPILAELGKLDYEAQQARKHNVFVNRADHKRLARLVEEEGGHFVQEGKKWFIQLSNGEMKPISLNKIEDLVKHGMISEDPTPSPPDWSGIKM